MTNCSPSFTSALIPVNDAACGVNCEGVSYEVDSVTSSTEGAKCSFSWSVTRTTEHADGRVTTKTFTGSAVVPCPGQAEFIFFCDDAGICPVFKLIVGCGVDVEAGSGGDGGDS